MKRLLFIIITVCSVLAFQSCEEDNELIFTAVPSDEGVAFVNNFANEYLLSEATEDNIAERFVWNEADFGVPANISYDLQTSFTEDFAEFETLGTTTETNLGVSVAQMIEFAELLGLDDDPNTTDEDGNPNNTGTVYFRLRAYVGAGTGNNTDMLSDITSLNIRWIEQMPTGGGCDPVFALGDALLDAQWDWGSAISFGCESDVWSAKVNLTNGTFRFFTTEGNWDSGLNYPYFEGEGYTIDANFENAADGDSNFQFTGTPGIYTLTIDDNNKVITLEPSGSVFVLGGSTFGEWTWDNANEMTEISPDVYELSLEFSPDTFRFFTTEGDWGSGLNYPYFVAEGYTIDENFEDAIDGDNNFRFIGTPGTYTITLDFNNQTITLQ